MTLPVQQIGEGIEKYQKNKGDYWSYSGFY